MADVAQDDSNGNAKSLTYDITKPIPSQAIQPVVTHYLKYWFGRGINEPKSSPIDYFPDRDRYDRWRENSFWWDYDGHMGPIENATPLVEAVCNQDETSVFILCHWNQLATAATTTSSSLAAATTEAAVSPTPATSAGSGVNLDYLCNSMEGMEGMTSLHMAVESKLLSISRLLLENGADPNIRTAQYSLKTPLDIAIGAIDENDPAPDFVLLLLEHGADVNLEYLGYDDDGEVTSPSAFCRAASDGNWELIKLFQHKATLESMGKALVAASSSSWESLRQKLDIIDYLMDVILSHESEIDDTLVSQSFGECATNLVGWGFGGYYEFMKHRKQLQHLVVKLLKKGRASCRRMVELLGISDYDDNRPSKRNAIRHEATILHAAVEFNMTPVINIILTRRDSTDLINVVSDPDGLSPLHVALLALQSATDGREMRSRVSVIKLLIEKGADVNATTGMKNTPMHFVSDWCSDDTFTEAADIKSIAIREKVFTSMMDALILAGADAHPCFEVNGEDSETERNTALATAVCSAPKKMTNSSIVSKLVEFGMSNQVNLQLIALEVAGSNLTENMKIILDTNVSDSFYRPFNGQRPCNGETVLTIGASNGSLEMLKLLLSRGPPESIQEECHWGNSLLLLAMVGGCNDGNKLASAAHEKIVFLLEHGMNRLINIPDGDGHSPLMIAIYGLPVETVELLLEHGGNIRQRDREGNSVFQFVWDRTPATRIDVVKLLLKSGAACDIDYVEAYGGRTPLYRSVGHQHTEMVELCLRHGADPNILCSLGDDDDDDEEDDEDSDDHPDDDHHDDNHHENHHNDNHHDDHRDDDLSYDDGDDDHDDDDETETALHCAVKHRDYQIVRLLIEYGADPLKKDSNGLTPLDIAQFEGDNSMQDLLLGHVRPGKRRRQR